MLTNPREISDEAIIADIRQVAKRLGTRELSRSQYKQHGRYSEYYLYDGGRTWESLCSAAGVTTKKVEPVPDEVYLKRLRSAIDKLGRLPKVSERKRFGLNFSKRRFPTLAAFFEYAASVGAVPETLRPTERLPQVSSGVPDREAPQPPSPDSIGARPVPPIPQTTRRRKWERTGIEGFPYAPQDELGVVALFGILCARGVIGWQILELSGGRGIDAMCFDHVMQREIRVELKHTLSKASWNHKIDEIDHVVCWENRWRDFPKPVLVLREMLLLERNVESNRRIHSDARKSSARG